ncbi:hypothetical protein EDE05_12131 [Neorhizobium sp. R1-B]|jgi:hypothetical protein|uniref:hypothetical protein n=1 Tax=unclassified Neorhizobium TaxID=2629175 RepID=UPI0010433E4F|nr:MULTISPECIES: hypothetical protein [unclassified Neorhizobium]TCV66357.1 hypothetical protein EDE09_116108 [Neorhizobium sp. S3-V5DH]TDX74597.1 hypothetical protein EDE05_12131 [Neorhizobium sp. R1-B]
MGVPNPAEIEQTKLLANALDRASTACFTVGIATPLAGYVYNLAAFNTISGARMVVSLAGWLLSAILLHYLARRALRRLA